MADSMIDRKKEAKLLERDYFKDSAAKGFRILLAFS
jgi:hypothetical protein